MQGRFPQYRRLFWVAIGILALLVLAQVLWLKRAVDARVEEQQQTLRRIVPEVATAVNAIDHSLFHGDLEELAHLSTGFLEQRIDSVLENYLFEGDIQFALYQESVPGFFLSNSPEHREELTRSEIRACMSCIVSFSIAPSLDTIPGESEAEYRKRLDQNSTFQYFSPVTKIDRAPEEILWLSLHQSDPVPQALRSLFYLFAGNLFLLLILLLLFRYLIRSLTRYRSATEAKEAFFNQMTHEFKTPLSSIRLASRVLRQSEDREKNATYHQVIERESQRLEEQVDKLLMLSLLDEKGLEINQEPVDLHAVIAEIPIRLRLLIEEKKATVEWAPSEEKPVISGDREHLSNSLANLVENSLKYSDPGVRVEVVTIVDNGMVTILVKDNGPGIPPEAKDQIFDRFFRAQGRNQYKGKGFGIGLSYVQTVVRAHGGTISLNQAPPPGCQFKIELPCLK